MTRLEKFENQYVPEPNSGCWLWLGGMYGSGYGATIDAQGITNGAHRAAYELHVGVIPAGAVVRHKCDVKLCVNPTHLLLGTQADNIADVVARGLHGYKKRKTCKYGHVFTVENTHIRKGGARVCRECRRLKSERERPQRVEYHRAYKKQWRIKQKERVSSI